MNKFKIGDRVECVANVSCGNRRTVRGATAKVIVLHGERSISVVWDDDAIQKYFMREYAPYHGGHWDVISWKRARHTITDWTKVTTRAGHPVDNVTERPYNKTIRATVTVAGRDLVLTYNEYGEFYPGFESPVDLVQV